MGVASLPKVAIQNQITVETARQTAYNDVFQRLMMLRQQMSRVSRNFMWTNHEGEKKLLEKLSEKTGGAYTSFGAHLFRFPWKGYMLGLKLPEGSNRLEKWNIKLRESTAIMSMHPKLYVPEQLLPCGAEDMDR